MAINNSQRLWAPHANWLATIYHGSALEQMPFADDPGEYRLVVGRAAPEKGVAEAIELDRRIGLPLRMVMKVHDPAEMELIERVVRPARWTKAWSTEPFGLVAIESLATGTPVIARRGGALPEIVEHGGDGYLVDDLSEAELAVRLGALDRADIRRHHRLSSMAPMRSSSSMADSGKVTSPRSTASHS